MMIPILSTIVALIGGLGLGSLLTTFLKDRMDRKSFIFQEKLKVYSGYLEALKLAQINSSHENRQNVVYWHQRIKLLSASDVDIIAARFYDSAVQGEAYVGVRDDLLRAMKKDLWG
jgi:hypothetical protein